MSRLPVLVLLAACSHPEPNKIPRDSPDPQHESRPDDTGPESPPIDSRTGTGPDSVPDPPDDTDDTTPPVDTAPNAGQRYTGPTRVLVATAGAVTLMDPASGVATTVSGTGTLGFTVTAACVGDSIWLLDGHTDGTADRVVRIDATTGTVTSTWDLDPFVRPTDIEKVGDFYWITSYSKDRIYVATDTGPNGSFVSLDAHADGDGLPESLGVWNLGDSTAVVVGRFGQSDNSRNGAKLLVFNNNSYALESTIDLVGHSPSGRMLVEGDTLWLEIEATANGAVLATDSGVEEVNLATSASNGLRVDDSATGTASYVAYLDGLGRVAWRGFNPSGGGEWAGVWNLGDGVASQSVSIGSRIAGLGTISGTTLWVGENGFDNVSGALVSRQTSNGTELSRLALDGPVVAMAVCERNGP